MSMQTSEELKRQAARAACEYVMPRLPAGAPLGIGTGSTVNHFIDAWAQALAGSCAKACAVSSSLATEQRLREKDIRVVDLNTLDVVPFYIDGADEITRQMEMLKGGGGALTREKIVAAVAETFICIADESKLKEFLGAFPLPVEVIPMARQHVIRQLRKLGGKACWREKYVTDNGHHILDVSGLSITDARTLETTINQISGVISNGLFALRGANLLFLGTRQGIRRIEPKAV